MFILENRLFSERNYSMDSCFVTFLGGLARKMFLLENMWLTIPKSSCGTQ